MVGGPQWRVRRQDDKIENGEMIATVELNGVFAV
jgi:hypothetical protein